MSLISFNQNGEVKEDKGQKTLLDAEIEILIYDVWKQNKHFLEPSATALQITENKLLGSRLEVCKTLL